MNERQRAGAGRGARVAAECYFLAALSLSSSVSESRPVSFVGSPAAGRHKQGSAADQYCQPAPTHPLTAAVENTSGRAGWRASSVQPTHSHSCTRGEQALRSLTQSNPLSVQHAAGIASKANSARNCFSLKRPLSHSFRR